MMQPDFRKPHVVGTWVAAAAICVGFWLTVVLLVRTMLA